jgi:hypothetical protein
MIRGPSQTDNSNCWQEVHARAECRVTHRHGFRRASSHSCISGSVASDIACDSRYT